MMDAKNLFPIVAFMLLTHEGFCQDGPFVVFVNSTYPSGRTDPALAYIPSNNDDGHGVIYSFGGRLWTKEGDGAMLLQPISKFSIDDDTLKTLGPIQMPVNIYGGSAFAVNGSVYHLGGYTGSTGYTSAIYKLDPFQGVTQIGDLPIGNAHAGAVQLAPDNPEKILLFGGAQSENWSNIVEVDLRTGTSAKIATLPIACQSTTAAWVPEKGSVYIFCQEFKDWNGYYEHSAVLKYVPTELTTTIISRDGNPRLDHPSAVWAGDVGYAYVFGQWGRGALGPLQFDPVSEETKLVPVPGFDDYHGAEIVYVEGLTRIYSFGGFQTSYRREIYYLDLNPVRKNTGFGI